ncbi:MAG: ArnT family glycosyltransferase [Roseiflexus sp.]
MHWLYPQHMRIAFPAASGGVVLLMLVLLQLVSGARLARLDLHLTVDDPNARRVLVGFYDVERNSTDVFRWSRPEAALFLLGFDGRPAQVVIRMAAPRDETDLPLLTVSMRGRTVGTFPVAAGWRRYSLLTPTDPAGDTPLLLRTSAYRAPGDGRDLGLVLSDVAAMPLTGSVWFPPPVRTIFLASFPVLGWLVLLWRKPRLAPESRLLRWIGVTLLALLAGTAAAFPRVSGYWLPTVGWPWWPLLPLALVVAWQSIRPLVMCGVARLRALGLPALWGGAGLVLMLAVALRLGLPPVIGMSGLVATVALIAVASGAYVDVAPVTIDSGDRYVPRTEALALVTLTIVALALRLYRLDDIPAGMWRDEARHGLQALRIWNDPTYRPVYVVADADLPALMFYLMAPVLAITGPGAGAARLVSALAGALMPLALWWAARPILGARAAVYGAAFLAWASWGLSMSRWAFPATLDHLLELTAIGIMWRALDQPSYRRLVVGMAMAGTMAALAAYAYHTGRLAPLVFALLTALRLGHNTRAWRQALPGLVAAAVAGMIVLLPLLWFIAGDFEGYNRRTSAVAIANSQNLEKRTVMTLVLDNVARYLEMWHIAGDPNGRHHAPGAPMLDPLAGACFAVGVGLAVAQWRTHAFIPPVWLALALIPGIFSTNAPHAMRSLGALAPACMLAGMALNALVASVRNLPLAQRRRIALTVVTGTLAFSLGFNVWLYFIHMPHNPRVYREFDLTETAAGRVVRTAAQAGDPRLRAVQIFLDRRLIAQDTVRFLTFDVTFGAFDGVQLSEGVDGDALLILPPDAADDERAAALAALGPAARTLETPLLPNGEAPLFLAYGVGDGAQQLLAEAFPGPR